MAGMVHAAMAMSSNERAETVEPTSPIVEKRRWLLQYVDGALTDGTPVFHGGEVCREKCSWVKFDHRVATHAF